MEIVLFILFSIIIAVFETRGGRLYGYRRRSLVPIGENVYLLRDIYEERLRSYYENNAPKSYLINRYCEAKLINDKFGDIRFYVKERTNGKKSGKYFEVKGDKNHAGTMWAIFDMEFKSTTKYSDLKNLYFKLNQNSETRFFHEPFRNKLPEPEMNHSAQNEFCRMEMKTLPNGEKIILCSEIWGANIWDKPQKFIIKADKYVLYNIFTLFINEKNKMEDYKFLLCRYLSRQDIKVIEVTDEEQLAEQNIPEKIKSENAETKSDVKIEGDFGNLDKNKVDKSDERNLDL